MRRNKHSLSHYQLATFNMGELIPVANFEVLPGDSIRMSTSCLLRVSPLMTPVMHPVVVRIHHWYVPYRLLWSGWENFITGGPDGLGGGAGAPPTYTYSDLNTWRLPDYMGVPPAPSATYGVSKLPFRAYNKIYNENYRDQDLKVLAVEDNIDVHNIAWEKDYFTTGRPWPQKGPDVTLPLGDRAPVYGIGIAAGAPFDADMGNIHETGASTTTNYANEWRAAVAGRVAVEDDPDNTGFPNIWADLAAASAVDVNDVRRAFALQRYQEARAQYGSRYTEYLQYLGVRPSDARLQRPEYLGGGRSTIAFSEVLKTGEGDTPADDSPIGEMRGHGISAMRTRSFTRFFEEHGIVISLCSIRPRTIYQNGLHRKWTRETKEDYWQKELELIGQQEILNKEVYATHLTPNGTFGYGDRYSEYRSHPSYVSGDFRTTMADWHLARLFGSTPALNSDFIDCVPSKRIHAVNDESVSNHTIWGMFSHNIRARRMVTHKTIGRIF